MWVRLRAVVPLRLWYFLGVFDRKLLQRLMSPSPKSQVCSSPHSHESVIFFEFLGFICFKLWRVCEFSLIFTAAV